MRALIFVLFIVLISLLGIQMFLMSYNYNYKNNNNYNKDILNKTINQTDVVTTDNKTINYTKLNELVVEELKSYINVPNYSDYNVVYLNASWTTSSYYGNGVDTNIIYMGVTDNYDYEQGIRIYRMVFAHEYTHLLLAKLGLDNGELHEALADTYMWYLYPNESAFIWGEQDENREFPYYLIVRDKLFKENKFSCLDNFFNTTSTNLTEIKMNLQISCNITLEYFDEIQNGTYGTIKEVYE